MARDRDALAVDLASDVETRPHAERGVEDEAHVGDALCLVRCVVGGRAEEPVAERVAGMVRRDHYVAA